MARITELSNRGVEFALAWRVAGNPTARLDHSKSMSLADALGELTDLLEFHTENARS